MAGPFPESRRPLGVPARPRLLVLSGPSGVGKDAVLDKLKESDLPLFYVTTLTTRKKRPGEKDNHPYHFVSVKKFQELIQENGLLEFAEVYGNWYGVPREPVRQALEDGRDAMVKVDIQGAASIKKIIPQAVTIFLMPPSQDELLSRLSGRRTESAEELDLRLRTAEKEINQVTMFDYAVVNRDNEVEAAVEEIKAIVVAEKLRVKQDEILL